MEYINNMKVVIKSTRIYEREISKLLSLKEREKERKRENVK
jgi:hypothetical protein